MPDSLSSGQWRSGRQSLPGLAAPSRGIAFRTRSGEHRLLLHTEICQSINVANAWGEPLLPLLAVSVAPLHKRTPPVCSK